MARFININALHVVVSTLEGKKIFFYMPSIAALPKISDLLLLKAAQCVAVARHLHGNSNRTFPSEPTVGVQVAALS